MKFQYTARTKDGKTVTGVFEAVNRETLIAALNKQGAKPLLIKNADGVKPDAGGIPILGGFFKPKVKLKEVVVFTRQLSTMVSAGVPLPRSLATLGDQAESKYFKSVIAGVAKDVESGISLGEAFGKYPNVFSDVFVNMVKAGEAGGILDDILKRVAAQLEKDATIRKKIKGAMTYPTVVFCFCIVAFFGLMIGVIPKIGKILKDLGGPDAKLPIYTEILLNISNFCISSTLIKGIPNIVFVLAAAGIIISQVMRYIRTPKGKYQFHALMLRTPVLKNIIIKVAVARFARTFAALTSSGVTVLEALEVTGGAIGNKVIEAELKEAAKQVRNGKPLSEPIAANPHFPAIVSQMLAVGEETGQIDTVLLKVAEFYEEEVDTVIDSLSSIIEPIMILFMGGMVGIIAASVMGPIASLSQNIGE